VDNDLRLFTKIPRFFYKRIARLAFQFERTLKNIHKMEKQLLQFTVPNSNNDDNLLVRGLRELVYDIPNIFRAELLKMLSEPVNTETISAFETAAENTEDGLEQFQMDWKELSTSFAKSLENRNELVDFYKDCSALISFVESKFNCYYDELQIHFQQQKNLLRTSSCYEVQECEKVKLLSHYLETFPFKQQLPQHLLQSRQSSSTASSSSIENSQSIHLEAMEVILQIQPLFVELSSERPQYQILGNGYEDEDDEQEEEKSCPLDIINCALALNSRSSSETKRKLSLEYLKCCLEFFSVEMLYRKNQRSYSHRKLHFQVVSGSFLKMQRWLWAIVSLEEGSFCWKIFELLRKLPHVESGYFRSLLTWMISALLVEKEVDPLLFEIWDSPELSRTPALCHDSTGYFPLYFILLKYYLPEKYFAQID
jgi:hypothetical protein